MKRYPLKLRAVPGAHPIVRELVAHCDAQGLTLAALARCADVEPRALQYWAKGYGNPGLRELTRLLEALRLDLVIARPGIVKARIRLVGSPAACRIRLMFEAVEDVTGVPPQELRSPGRVRRLVMARRAFARAARQGLRWSVPAIARALERDEKTVGHMLLPDSRNREAAVEALKDAIMARLMHPTMMRRRAA